MQFADPSMPMDEPLERLRPMDVTPARTWHERLTALGAFCTLIFVDLVMKLAGFNRFHDLVRRWPTRDQSTDRETAERICTAVDRAATYYFKRAWCLQRSATATCLLRWNGVPAELVIGVQKAPFYAHAWVEVEGRVLNDHPIVQDRYTVLERC